MIVNNVDDVKQLRRYWTAVVLTAIIVGTVGLAQIPSGERVTAPFEGTEAEPNTFAGYLAFLILICVAMGLVLPQHGQRVLYFLVAGYLFVPFLFTLSRAAYMGIVPGLAAVFFHPQPPVELRFDGACVVPCPFPQHLARGRS